MLTHRTPMTFDILSDGPKILNASSDELEEWMSLGFAYRRRVFGNGLLCFSPTAYPYSIPDHKQRSSQNFISISITGTSCALQCKHCKGHLLKGMEPVLTPDALVERCRTVAASGGEGVLISGGSDPLGHVPIDGFIDAITKVKQELCLQVVVHTGLVTRDVAEGLCRADVDAVMLDVIGDSGVAGDVYHLPDGVRLIKESLSILDDTGVRIAPHILVGLNYGHLAGEIEALDMISEIHPDAVVIIALSPLRNTPMAGVAPPSPESIGRIMTAARLGLESVPLLLGCARPMGKHKIETDEFAIKCGANGIAYVSQEGVNLAREIGLHPVFKDVCCSLAYQFIE